MNKKKNKKTSRIKRTRTIDLINIPNEMKTVRAGTKFKSTLYECLKAISLYHDKSIPDMIETLTLIEFNKLVKEGKINSNGEVIIE